MLFFIEFFCISIFSHVQYGLNSCFCYKVVCWFDGIVEWWIYTSSNSQNHQSRTVLFSRFLLVREDLKVLFLKRSTDRFWMFLRVIKSNILQHFIKNQNLFLWSKFSFLIKLCYGEQIFHSNITIILNYIAL